MSALEAAGPSGSLTVAELARCDQERIHVPGAIQPYGCMLVSSLPTWTIDTVSANVGIVFNVDPAALLDRPLDTVLPHKTVHDLRNVLQAAMVSGASERMINARVDDSDRRFDLTLHASGQNAIIEVIPQDGAHTTTVDPVILVKSMIGRVKRVQTLERFLGLAASQIRAVTGFDRVMIYKFLEDQSGEVVAESLRSGLAPYLGLRYPATDIPAQARALYKRQWLRLIPDAQYTPVPLVSATPRNEIDLSLATLRSVSPIHREYMHNMGTRASLTISLIDNDRLWGLIACHHESPRRIASSTCAAAELFGQVFSMQIEAKEQAKGLLYATRARETHDRLLASMPPEATLFDDLPRFAGNLQELIPCDGVGICAGGRFTGHGACPPEAALPDLLAMLGREAKTTAFATDSLQTHLPSAREYAADVSGVLAIPFVRDMPQYLLFFRREVVQTVTWGGNPHKAVEGGPQRLNPRTSFEAWREIVSGKSTPWLTAELQIAEALRVSLLEIVLRQADLVARQRKVAEDSQNFLIAELNHRVKNILALMRSLVRQSKIGAGTIETFATDLEQRIHALALAHDQLTASGWKHTSLRRLIEAEAQAWTHSSDRISMAGPPVLLDSRAFQSLALVFHEMMTNAVKYGSLSRPAGRLSIQWSLLPDKDLKIEWREMGGPTVSMPSRRGFGSVVVGQTIPFELGGTAVVEYRAEGVHGTFVVPADHLDRGETEEVAEPIKVAEQPLAAKRLLLVEDSMMIALDAQAMLGESGLEVEVAGTVADASRSLGVNRFDAAVLDINLSGETTFGLADSLTEVGLPFVFATGYGESIVIPDRFRDVPIVSKPYDKLALRAALYSAEDGIARERPAADSAALQE